MTELRRRPIEYTKLEHAADTGYQVLAPSMERLFVNAGLALTDHIASVTQIDELEKETVCVKADNLPSLLVQFLTKILTLFDTRKFVSARIIMTRFSITEILATLHGENYDPIRHGKASEIKAVTYHQLEIGRDEQNQDCPFFAKIFLDL